MTVHLWFFKFAYYIPGHPIISKARTVKEYLASLPADRRPVIEAVRKVVLKDLDRGYEEGMQYGMIGYYVPHRLFPPGYHCDPSQPLTFAGIASQKNHMAIYLMCVYGHNVTEKWFRQEWAKTGKKLDMGKSCIRFKKLDDVALDVIGETIRRVPAKRFIEHYVTAMKAMGKDVTKTVAPKKPAAKKKSAARS